MSFAFIIKIHNKKYLISNFKLLCVKSISSEVSSRRIVVTGLGAISPVGYTAIESWKNVLDGACGIKKLGTKFSSLPCTIAGYIPLGVNQNQLNLRDHFHKSELQKMTKATAFATVAAEEALKDAGWRASKEEDLMRTGVAIGTGLVDMEEICHTNYIMLKRGYSKVNPYFIPRMLNNMTAGQISMRYGFRGPNHSASTACATGVHSIGDAYRFLKWGDADVMVCGSAESCICPLSIAAFCRLRTLCTRFNKDPDKASRPFDRDRDGFILGEGSGIIILEELQHALDRGSNIYAEILGYGMSSDASHVAIPRADGSGPYLAMSRALKDANVDASSVGYVNANATSSTVGDAAEAKAIKNLFGEESKNVFISSTKGSTGHLLGASGIIETIFTVMSVATGNIPPTINLANVTPDMELNYVRDKSQMWTQENRKIALKNAIGFGGTNASLCIAEFSNPQLQTDVTEKEINVMEAEGVNVEA